MSTEKTMSETTMTMTVTPEMAAEWLARNTRNRTINAAHVARLAEEIRNGRWRSTHQGIAFGADGTLYDGQHRLHAVIKAGVAVTMRVTFGLPVEALDAIDTGETRNAADVLEIADGRHMSTNKRSSIVAAYSLVTLGAINLRGRTTVAHLRAALADHGDDYDALREHFAAHDRLTQGPMVGALCICHKVAPAQTMEFARMLRDPSGLDKDHPAVALRDFVLLTYVAGNTNARMDLADRTFMAVRAYQRGQTRKFIRGGAVTRIEVLNAWRAAMGRALVEG